MQKKPARVFVNHGDDDSCSGFAEDLRKTLSLDAEAPYSGSMFDMASDQWIRLTIPVPRKKQGYSEKKETVRTTKSEPYAELQKAVAALAEYTGKLSSHSNSELRKLTKEILALINDPD